MKTKAFSLTALFLAALISASCKHSQTQEETNLSSQAETHDNIIRSMPLYDYVDTVQVGSHSYLYSIHREADKNLPVVSDDMGDRYYDNTYHLSVSRDGKQFFSQTYTKSAFADRLSRDFRKYGILDGFRFRKVEEGLLYFSVCVSFPESDMSAPFVLVISSDGSSSIQVDESLDGEEDDL